MHIIQKSKNISLISACVYFPCCQIQRGARFHGEYLGRNLVAERPIWPIRSNIATYTFQLTKARSRQAGLSQSWRIHSFPGFDAFVNLTTEPQRYIPRLSRFFVSVIPKVRYFCTKHHDESRLSAAKYVSEHVEADVTGQWHRPRGTDFLARKDDVDEAE